VILGFIEHVECSRVSSLGCHLWGVIFGVSSLECRLGVSSLDVVPGVVPGVVPRCRFWVVGERQRGDRTPLASERPAMMHGTVSDFDSESGVGIIESDDGDIVFFNTDNVQTFDADLLAIGLRVLFKSHEGELGPHADLVYLPH
jgi:cold shock CspA family protein